MLNEGRAARAVAVQRRRSATTTGTRTGEGRRLGAERGRWRVEVAIGRAEAVLEGRVQGIIGRLVRLAMLSPAAAAAAAGGRKRTCSGQARRPTKAKHFRRQGRHGQQQQAVDYSH